MSLPSCMGAASMSVTQPPYSNLAGELLAKPPCEPDMVAEELWPATVLHSAVQVELGEHQVETASLKDQVEDLRYAGCSTQGEASRGDVKPMWSTSADMMASAALSLVPYD